MKSAIYHGYTKPETRNLTPEELDEIIPPADHGWPEFDQHNSPLAGYVCIAVAITVGLFCAYVLFL